MKACTRCHHTKPLEQFHRNKKTSDGRDYKCTMCSSADRKALRRLRPEGFRALEAKRNKIASASRMKTRDALKTGTISKLPCFVCGTPEVEAHHPSYSLPLAVVWLCSAHHRQVHQEHRAALSA